MSLFKKKKETWFDEHTHTFPFPSVNELLKMADEHLGIFVFGKLYTTDAKGITLQIVGLTAQQISQHRRRPTASDL